MYQWYTLVFWSKAVSDNVPFETIAIKAFHALDLFNKLPSEYRPNYLKVKRLRDAKPFSFTYENFYDELQKGINKEGKRVFGDLGYNVSFFSSLNKSSCVGYSIQVGCTNKRFINTFIIDFPVSFPANTSSYGKEIKEIFLKVIDLLDPFWAGFVNDAFPQDTGGFPKGEERKITSVHWLNYWGKEMLNQLDRKKLAAISIKFPQVTYSKGFLQMQELALDINNDKDVAYKREIEKYLLS